MMAIIISGREYSPKSNSILVRTRRRVLFAFLILALLSILPMVSFAESPILDVSAKSAVLIDAGTGRIVFEKNDDQPLPVASMSKMMTEYLVLEKIKQNMLTWDTEVKISPYAAAVSVREDLSNVPLTVGGVYKVRDLFEAVSIYSANAAAAALAETVAGSEEQFAVMMNAKAAELKLTGSHFVNSSGLEMTDIKEMTPWCEGRNTMTALDCGKLAYFLVRDFPEMLSFSSIPKKTFGVDAYAMINRNQMLPGLDFGYEGTEGLKTGYTEMAGYCFTGVIRSQGALWISVIVGATSSADRFGETKKLFELSRSYERRVIRLADFHRSGMNELRVKNGDKPILPVKISNDFTILTKPGNGDRYELFFVPDTSLINEKGELKTAIHQEQIIGYYALRHKGDSERFIDGDPGDHYRVQVCAGADIKPENSDSY